MKPLRYTLFYMLAASLLLASCHKDRHEEPQPATQTVLVYMAADNNLSSYGFVQPDLRQMMAASRDLPSDCHLVIFVDQLGKKPYILTLEQGDTLRRHTFDEELATCDPATLRLAYQWAADHYPARSYGLVLWGHSDGWVISNAAASRGPRHAYGIDNTAGRRWMDIPDMAATLAAMPHLRFIFADCCCFQCVETAYELRHTTDYIIGSAAEIPGEGAPYQTVLPALFSQRPDFYQLATDAYFAQVSEGFREPLSVVKTSEMEALAAATRTALTQSLQPIASDGTGYPDVKGLIYYYDQMLFDMNDFFLRFADASTYAQWKQHFDAAVVYSTWAETWMSDGHVPYIGWSNAFLDFEVTEERYGGLSMFVPQNSSIDKKQQQNRTIHLMQWYQAAGLSELGW